MSTTAPRAVSTAALQEHKAELRAVFGGTLSDEFVDVMPTQLINMLAPGPFDVLEEATLNAAIAVIASIRSHSWEKTMPDARRRAGIRRPNGRAQRQLQAGRDTAEAMASRQWVGAYSQECAPMPRAWHFSPLRAVSF
jgi:hypothetical protein